MRADLLFYAVSLVDTAYKFGGQLPQSGLDCSGFVRYVFQQAAHIHLPHTAKGISDTGETISETQLRPGDLVFFNTMKRAFSHVGIYLGNNRFIHAASSKTGKVMISDMTEAYWAKRYEGSRRIATVLATSAD
jgi:cell wall-associated NlpC family hydrolase